MNYGDSNDDKELAHIAGIGVLLLTVMYGRLQFSSDKSRSNIFVNCKAPPSVVIFMYMLAENSCLEEHKIMELGEPL